MPLLIKLLLVLFLTAAINLPFGYRRRGLRKFSLPWILAVHLPIPLVVAFRVGLGIPYAGVPLVIAAAVAGQWAGGRFFPGTQYLEYLSKPPVIPALRFRGG